MNAIEVLRRIKKNPQSRLLDVRSEGEFAKGQIPGAINIPILNDDHRAQVGTAYKQLGRERAMGLGHELVAPFREEMIKKWAEQLGQVSVNERIVTCWRGGLRSKIACDWLEAAGVNVHQVEGGFKALRCELLQALDHPPELLLLGGLTGSGKTTLLRALDASFVLDLELLANHRGSIFGGFFESKQPAQVTFENAVGLQFFERKMPFVCEAESRLIGYCSIPNSVKSAMDLAPMVLMKESLEVRTKNIFDEYVVATFEASPNLERWQQMHAHFQNCVTAIQQRLGGELKKTISTTLSDSFREIDCRFEKHASWISMLLESYYDRLYTHSLKSNNRNITFEGNWQECREFIAAGMKRWT